MIRNRNSDKTPSSVHYASGLAVILFLSITPLHDVEAQIIINEFMASNTSIYPDMCDYDDFSDWIELYNTTDQDVNLKGYYLTDNLKEPRKWAIPDSAKIAAKGFLVFRADGADSRPGVIDTLDSYPWNVKFTTKRYHTNFKLAEEGEAIGLFRDSGTVTIRIDSVIFSNQQADISLGRNPLLNNAWYRYDQPTPGGANTTDGKTATTYSGSVGFSIRGGFYDAAQTLTMTAATGEIYYTIDGSIPFKTSTKYTGPLAIDATTPIRARCIEPAKLAGKVTTETYFINAKKRGVMTASITIDTGFLYSQEIGVFRNSWKNREIPLTMELFGAGGKQIAKVNAGMDLGTRGSFTCPQKPLNIKLKGGTYGDDFIWYRLFDKPAASFSRIRLRQGSDAWSSTMITDALFESICAGQLEIGAAAYRPTVLFINGTYYGLHDMREDMGDDLFFTNNYNVDPSTMDHVRSQSIANSKGGITEGWVLERGTWDKYRALISLAKNGQITDEKYAQLNEQVDINSCIDFFCTIVFCNQITWTHNQELWRVADGKWRWLIADCDRAFTISGGLAGRTRATNLLNGSSGVAIKDTLLSRLLGNPEFNRHFTQRFAAHLNSTFLPKRLNSIIDSISSLVSPEMGEQIAKWGPQGGVASMIAWQADLDSMKLFIGDRRDTIIKQFANAPFNRSATARLTVALSNPDAGAISIEDVRMNRGLDSMKFFTGLPLQIKAIAKPGFVFAGWNEGTSTEPLMATLSGDSTITAKFEVSRQHVVPATIATDTTFSLTDNPYVALNDIIVDTGATLTIEKGVTLLMAQDADIVVLGRLLVNGSSDAPVTIRENTGTGAVNWGAINFEKAIDTNIISWLKVSGTTLGNDPLSQRGGINGNGSNVVMDHLDISNVIYPMYFEGGHVVLRNSTIIIDHICNGGIHVGRCTALIENNFWASTGKTINTDAIDVKGTSGVVIRGNRLYNFNGYNSDGIDLGENAKNTIVDGNYIYGSRDKGVSCGGASTCSITNNIIVECDIGIGIKDEGSYATLDHNTIVRNRVAIAVYEKASGRGGGSARVTNSILAASKARSIFEDRYSSIELSNCLSDIDHLPGAGNLSDDPLFIDLLKNNFQLKAQSPCINAGDPTFRKDTDSSTTDIGAQYTFDSSDFPASLVPAVTPPYVVLSELMYNDDKKSSSGDWIELHNPTDNEIDLTNWKLTDEGDYTSWETAIDIAELGNDDIYCFPVGTKLTKNGYLVICADTALFGKAYPDAGGTIIGNLPFGLNGTETVFLYNNVGALVNAVVFNTKNPWPSAADGDGPSLELIDAANLNYHPRNWGVSNGFGTPGKPNRAIPVMRQVKVAASFAYRLSQNFPNPFRSATTIRFALPASEHVKITIYSISGRLLETLINKKVDAGIHSVRWDAIRLPAGVYFYRIQAGRYTATKKLTIQ